MLQQLLWLLVFSTDMHHLQHSARFATVDDSSGRGLKPDMPNPQQQSDSDVQGTIATVLQKCTPSSRQVSGQVNHGECWCCLQKDVRQPDPAHQEVKAIMTVQPGPE